MAGEAQRHLIILVDQKKERSKQNLNQGARGKTMVRRLKRFLASTEEIGGGVW